MSSNICLLNDEPDNLESKFRVERRTWEIGFMISSDVMITKFLIQCKNNMYLWSYAAGFTYLYIMPVPGRPLCGVDLSHTVQAIGKVCEMRYHQACITMANMTA